MNLTAQQMQFLADKGLSLADVIEFASLTSDRSKGAERQARYRARQKEEDAGEAVTSDVTRDASRGDDAPALSPFPNENKSNPNPHTHPDIKTRARKGPIPADWQPQSFGDASESRKVEDAWPPGERAAQVEQFKAHHRAKGSTFTDPQAAWSTWVLNSRKFGNVRPNHRPERPTTRQLGERVAARFASPSGSAADSLPRLGSSGWDG